MSKVGTAGLAAMGALATATVAGLAKCTSEAAKLENNMSAMVRYVDGLTESATTSTEQAQSNLKAMRTYIQDLSTQIPRTTEQISKMSAALGQSGIGADRQMSTGILRDTAVAATAMDLEDDTAGNYMAKWEAAFNFNHDQVMTLMDQINYLGANNATTAGGDRAEREPGRVYGPDRGRGPVGYGGHRHGHAGDRRCDGPRGNQHFTYLHEHQQGVQRHKGTESHVGGAGLHR